MLDRSECKKPAARCSFRGVRCSKFRHVYGIPAKKEKCYDNIRITKNAHDSSFCAVNPKFVAVVVEVGGGGSFLVIPVEKVGRVDLNWSSRIIGHTAPVLDIKWSPFNDNIIASSSEDCTVKVWYIPDGQMMLEMTEGLVTLTGHKRKVGAIDWHPSANNILASVGYDNMVIIWNVTKAVPVLHVSSHPDTVFSLSWNLNGSHLVTSCKDKKLRIIDARSGKVTSEGSGHQGGKPSKVVWCGDKNIIFTTGFSKFSERQFAVWEENDLSKPLKMETLDSSSGVLTPFYDPDTSMMYIAGKGDGNIRFYEILTESPWACYLNQFISGTPHRSLGVMPKRGVDVMACEITRFYKLHTVRDMVEPISMVVPRKTEIFQDDIYPETSAPIPALTEEEWISGKNANPIQISMKTGANIKTYKPVMYKLSEQAIVVSEKNNDRKFMFLSEETKPDYRPRSRINNFLPSPRPQGSESSKSSGSEQRAWEGNLTKFQRVQRKWTNGSVNSVCLDLDLDQIYTPAIPTGASSVMDLTQRFSNNNNRRHNYNEKDEELSRVMSDQFRRIGSLRSVVEEKERRIQQLETRLGKHSKQSLKKIFFSTHLLIFIPTL